VQLLVIDPERFAAWFTAQWADRSPSTWNVSLDAIRSAPPGGYGRAGAIDVIIWQTGTARLLPRLLKGRKSGPVFITGRKARVQLPAADLDPSGRARLSYQQAAALFSKASGGATLHQLRHSVLTHDA
jgi:hypothetical protein